MELILKQPPSLHLLFWKRLVSTQRIKALFLKEDCTSSSTLTTDRFCPQITAQAERKPSKGCSAPTRTPYGLYWSGRCTPLTHSLLSISTCCWTPHGRFWPIKASSEQLLHLAPNTTPVGHQERHGHPPCHLEISELARACTGRTPKTTLSEHKFPWGLSFCKHSCTS